MVAGTPGPLDKTVVVAPELETVDAKLPPEKSKSAIKTADAGIQRAKENPRIAQVDIFIIVLPAKYLSETTTQAATLKVLALPPLLWQPRHMSDESSRLSLLWETIQQKEDYPIFRLVYLSRPVKPFTAADLDDIENKSIAANNDRDVTGLLVVNNDRVLQILEGREDSVRGLYDKIAADPRHTVVKLVCGVEDEVRLLLTWSMVVRGLSGLPSHLLEQFNEVYDDLLAADDDTEVSIDQVDLFKEIALFGPLSPVS